MSNTDYTVVPNKIFIGCPWKTIRPKYLKIVSSLEHKYPIHFILIGRENDQRAEELFGIIKKSLFSSTFAIFDVTGGNANVSLEYGLADGAKIDRALYLNVHGHNSKSKDSKDSAIIADLAGQRRRQWKNESSLKKLLNEFSKNHNFSKRFESIFKNGTSNISNRHKKKSYRALAIKIIHFLDDKESARRVDLVEQLRGESYDGKDIEFMINLLHRGKLISVSKGRYSDVIIS